MSQQKRRSSGAGTGSDIRGAMSGKPKGNRVMINQECRISRRNIKLSHKGAEASSGAVSGSCNGVAPRASDSAAVMTASSYVSVVEGCNPAIYKAVNVTDSEESEIVCIPGAEDSLITEVSNVKFVITFSSNFPSPWMSSGGPSIVMSTSSAIRRVAYLRKECPQGAYCRGSKPWCVHHRGDQ